MRRTTSFVRAISRVTMWAGLAAFAAGCGGGSEVETVPVSGAVTIDGQPIPQGSISFVPVDGKTPSGGGAIADGRYTANVPPGDKYVLVVGNKVTGKEKLYPDKADSPTRDTYETLTPPEYNADHLTPLKATVSGPDENLNFELTKKVKPRT